ncbi:MAG: PH domain-containing protein [Dermatophilaceae bacterium]
MRSDAMGFPESVLASNERVVRSIHPHWLTVLGPTVIGVVLLAGGAVLAWQTPDNSTGNWIQWVGLALALVILVWLVVGPYLRWRTTHYVITTHRVMVRRGVIEKVGKDITLSKITDVSFRQGLMDRIIKSGDLSIESAGDSPDETLRDIPHSDEVQQLINRLIEQDANRRAGMMLERMESHLPERPPLAEEKPATPPEPPSPQGGPASV